MEKLIEGLVYEPKESLPEYDLYAFIDMATGRLVYKKGSDITSYGSN